MELQARRVWQVAPVPSGQLVLREPRVHRALRDLKVKAELMVLSALPDLRVPKVRSHF